MTAIALTMGPAPALQHLFDRVEKAISELLGESHHKHAALEAALERVKTSSRGLLAASNRFREAFQENRRDVSSLASWKLVAKTAIEVSELIDEVLASERAVIDLIGSDPRFPLAEAKAICADLETLAEDQKIILDSVLDHIDELTPLGDGTDTVSLEEAFAS